MMNKGMIMDVNKNYAIALNGEGFMDKIISKQNMKVGQKIFYFDDDIVKTTTNKAHRHKSFIKAFGSIAALFLLVFTFFNTMTYEQAYAVVSLDINPSIQIEADSNQKIIKVEGVNTDGKDIDFSEIKDISLNDGIQKIKEKLIEKNYLDANKEVLVGFAFIKNEDNSTNEDNINYEKTLKDAIQSTFKSEKVTYVQGDKEAVDEAKTKGISLGRYQASLVADEKTKNTIDKAPVKDITSSIKDKENVTQWEATDGNTNTITPAATNINPDVTTQVPGKERPPINVPRDNVEPSSDKGEGKDKITKPKDNGVLELDPETPTQSDQGTVPNKPIDSNTIIIEPDNGTIKNNTTSGKIEENSNNILPEPSKTSGTLVNKDTNK